MHPSVIFVGPTKCGTTWIDSYLRTRPEICLPQAQKETFFFDKCFERGSDWYAAQFGSQDGAQGGIGVEVAPSLFHKPHARDNLAATLPDAKIVIVYRDPLDRAVSHYFHYRKAGVPRMALTEMVRAHPDIVNAGRFRTHMAAWEAAFPGQVFFLEYAMLKTDPKGFCDAVCAIVGIPPEDGLPEALMGQKVNAASIPRSALFARIGRRAAEAARRRGLHGLVNTLRETRLKQFLFSGRGNVKDERDALRGEFASFESLFDNERLQIVSPRAALPR